jgi:hypothetical protein
MFINNET